MSRKESKEYKERTKPKTVKDLGNDVSWMCRLALKKEAIKCVIYG